MRHRQYGYTMLEMIIALGLAASLGTIAVIAYIGYQRSAETVDGLATISIMEERFAVRQVLEGDQLVTCDNSLVRPGDLDNNYMELAITALPLDSTDPSKGFGGGVVVSATIDKVGANGIAVTQSLHDELVGQGAAVRGAVLTDSAVSFSVLLTSPKRPYCEYLIASKQPSANPNIQPTIATPPVQPNSQYKLTGATTIALTEDGAITEAGDLKVVDTLHTSAPVTLSDQVRTGTYGTFDLRTTGHWIYTLDNTNHAVQSLRANERVTDQFTIPLPDGQDAIFVATITGTSDLPVIKSQGTQSVSVSGAVSDLKLNGAADLSMFPELQRGVPVGARLTGLYMPGETQNRLAGTARGSLPTVHTAYRNVGSSGFVYMEGNQWFSRNLDAELNFAPLPPSVRNNWDGGLAVFSDGSVARLVKVCDGNGSERDYIYMKLLSGVDANAGVSVVSGQAKPGETIEVFEGSRSLGSVTADANGAWKLGTTKLSDGDHQIRTRINGQYSLAQTISVSGQNANVQSSATELGAVTSGSAPSTSGILTVTDADRDENPVFRAETMVGSFGAFTIKEDGSWQYQFDISKASSLTPGANADETFTVTAASNSGDSSQQEVKILVNG